MKVAQDRKIGQILLEKQFCSLDQLTEALYAQEEMKLKGGHVFKLGEILLFNRLINLSQLQGALSMQINRAQKSRDETMAAKDKVRRAQQILAERNKAVEKEGGLSFIKKFFKR